MRRLGSDLCSSARQAAHANARLGHSMATEREHLKAALTQAQKRISYLSADVNARLLFTAQPAKHASSPSSVAFAALMLPKMSNGLPTHWLSPESVESLRRWCEDEGMPLGALRCVIGRVVHVAGPLTIPSRMVDAADGPDSSSSNSANPYRLPAGEQYFVVHAEMMLQHRWT
uniref:Autophagy-related protein 11 C-terminal domain-containing protein n=1 Tax=Haptolina brevifila TaxID=156173 RepID=A0A7S2GGA2_9EUKA|mmetsp:Transcript_36907/g.73635  ORF Transcript_36907/g.73635 Transcript_36907/m.73635 type:complete len:173 (+) Transcript_36907:145-663(+)